MILSPLACLERSQLTTTLLWCTYTTPTHTVLYYEVHETIRIFVHVILMDERENGENNITITVVHSILYTLFGWCFYVCE